MILRYLYRAFKARYRDDHKELEALLSCIRPGDTVVDAGANKGSYLYWLSKAVGSDGVVLAFEPQPSLARYLNTICDSLRWKNVRVYDEALSDQSGFANLFIPGGGNSPGASLSAFDSGGFGESIECRVTTLDERIPSVGRVSALKVDVEGNELKLFLGAELTLRKHKPVIVFECEYRHLAPKQPSDVFGYLESLGYIGRFFSQTGLRPLTEFNLDIHQKRLGDRFWDSPDYCNNFYFFHPA
jgi:FkbM family methyltransferase